jgi:hypothetical protein
LCRYQRFQPETVHRSQLLNAPYNPRVMSPSAKRKLKRSLKENGYVNALVWNKRTGNLVGGHQRIEQLDSLEGKSDYRLSVDVIDVTPEEEVAINIALNNSSLQGAFDHDMLQYCASQLPKKNLEAAGFDAADLAVLFDPAVVETVFSDQAKAEQQTVADLDAVHQANRETPATAEDQTPEPMADAADEEAKADGPLPSQPQDAAPSGWSPERMAERREKYIERQRDRNDVEFMLSVIFDSSAQMDEFLDAVGLDKTSRYIPGYQLAERLGLQL